MKPTLFIICGHIGAGKTTIANFLSELLNIQTISVDQTINRLFINPSNKDKYAPFNKQEIDVCYNAFGLIAEYMLSSEKSLILDGVFAKNMQRKQVLKIAKDLNIPYYIIYVKCPESIIEIRSSQRFNKSKGVGWNAYKKYKNQFEPLNLKHYTINTNKDIKEQLHNFIKIIK